MAELDNKLYVYTCHTMYTTEDKLNHQANMIFTIDESTMKTVDYQYEISNLTQGYVSHSLNQYIKTYGDYIYRVDHSETGDLVEGGEIMAVNGITLTKFNKNDQPTEVAVTVPERFNIRRGNYTGSSIGGFEIGSDNCIIAFSQDISKTNRNRNVYLTVTDTSFYRTKKVPLTHYTDNDNITCGTPELVKISENLFLVMWEETNKSTNEVVTKGMTVDAKGQIVSSAKTLTARLSDCQPILCSDNLVKWYVTDNNGTTLYSLNPYYIESLHKHKYTSKVTKEPTCKETGIRTYTCECGDIYTESIATIDHKYQYKLVKQSTCKEEGLGKYTCTVCGDNYTETLPKIGHDYEQKVVKPTCTEQGYTLNVCKNCGDTYKNNFVDKIDHNYKYEVVKEPTCTEEGLGKYTCTECGDNYTKAISKTDHNYEQKVVKPTCTEQGYTLNVCKNCGDTYKSDFVDKIDHNYKYEVVKEPTCTEEGIGKYICTECGETLIDTIPTIDHSYITVITPATMKSNGRKISKCSICNNVQYDNVISRISLVSISKTTFTYNGKIQTPTVTVKDSKKKTLKNKTDYTVTYSSGRKNVGRYSVKVKFKGNYSGEKTFYYNIAPKSTSVKSVKGLSKGMQVNLKLQKTQTTGYQIQYSNFSNFKNAKTVTVKNNVSAKKITKLSGKKKYFVRVRTYKTTKFSGKNYNIYSSWSSAKTTVTK